MFYNVIQNINVLYQMLSKIVYYLTYYLGNHIILSLQDPAPRPVLAMKRPREETNDDPENNDDPDILPPARKS